MDASESIQLQLSQALVNLEELIRTGEIFGILKKNGGSLTKWFSVEKADYLQNGGNNERDQSDNAYFLKMKELRLNYSTSYQGAGY